MRATYAVARCPTPPASKQRRPVSRAFRRRQTVIPGIGAKGAGSAEARYFEAGGNLWPRRGRTRGVCAHSTLTGVRVTRSPKCCPRALMKFFCLIHVHA